MGPLIPAIFAAIASVSTSTPTETATAADEPSLPLEEPPVHEEPVPDVPLDDLPLTPEELALIGSLASTSNATTSSAAIAHAPRFWLAPAPLPRPTQIVPRVHLRESTARSIAEAFEPHPTVVDTARCYVPGDSAAIRGQSGHRVALYLDGIPLHHALTPSRETPGWFTIDPWMLSEALLERPGSIVLSPRGTAGAIRLETLAPRRADGVEGEAEFAVRSADRSTSTHATASLAKDLAAIRVTAGYNDYRSLRIPTSSVGVEHGGGYQRAAISARARLFGRTDDPFEVSGGFDFDRLLNVPRTDLGTNLRSTDRVQQRLLVFARAQGGNDDFGGSLLVSRQAFLTSRSMEGNASFINEEAATYFVRATGEARLIDELTLRAGGLLEISEATRAPTSGFEEALGRTQIVDGFLAADLATERVRGSVQAVLVRSASEPATGPKISDTRPLTQGGLRFSIWGPIGVRAGWTQGVYVPTLQDLRDAARELGPETSLSFDFGPSLYAREGWIELLGFYTVVKDAIEPERLASRRLTTIDDVRILGMELTGGWYLIDQVRIAGSLTWSEGQDNATGAPVVTFPSLTGRASVRYDFGIKNAYLEGHVRGSTDPIHVTSVEGAEPPASLSSLAPTSFARFGASGGMDLGLGFHLAITLENVLDTPHRAPASLVPGAGVDVRVALSYAVQ